MSGFAWSNLIGNLIGSIFAVYLLSLLFRYALLGKSGTKAQNVWVVILTGVVAIALSAFGDGTDGFMNRITNMPSVDLLVVNALSALLVGSVLWWRTKDKGSAAAKPPKKAGMIWRTVALLFAIPMILLAIGNIGGSVYSAATDAVTPNDPGFGVSRAEMRQIMLDGDMAPFWRMIDERAPTDMDYIIDRMFAEEATYRTPEDVLAKLNAELIRYRLSLSLYGPALTDTQRRELIQSQVDFLREFQNDPQACVVVANQGAAALSQERLSLVNEAFNRVATKTFELLLEARESAAKGVTMPTPPTDDDYALLGDRMYERGYTVQELVAVSNEDTSHPGFCNIVIGLMDELVALDGSTGKALRFETTQGLLTFQ